jgi:hypothetical protein
MDLLNEYTEVVTSVVHRHGGRVIDFLATASSLVSAVAGRRRVRQQGGRRGARSADGFRALADK